MAVRIGSARSSYGNTTRGDQHNGLEVSQQDWYLHSKGWRCFRAKDPTKRKMLAYAMKAACANNLIGYSQPDRLALKKQLESMNPVTYDPATVRQATNCDCSSLVRVCCFYAGIQPENFTTPYEPSKLMSTGAFVEMTDSKYTTCSAYLKAGDILVTKTQGHTVIVLTDGSKAEKDESIPVSYKFGDRTLKNGCEGDDVKELQQYLIQLGYDCGSYGADGDFGDCTEMSVTQFQRDKGIVADGVVGSETVKAITDSLSYEELGVGTSVVISCGNCYVRTEPNADADKLGVAYKGTSFVYGNERSESGWLKIIFKGSFGWVSGKYAVLK